MSLTKGKHIVQEIEGVLCTLIETGISEDRMNFLKTVLEHNQLEVKVEEAEGTEGAGKSFTIGVTDLVFNPVIAVYEKSLRRPDGKVVSPAYWNQETMVDHLPYFDYREKNSAAQNDDDFLPNPWAYRTL